MNAPILWILLPLLTSILLFFLRRWRIVINIIGTGLSLLLAILALVLPIDQAMQPGLVNLSITSEWNILGRVLTINQVDLPFIAFLYFMASVWFFLSWDSEKCFMFIPIGLGASAILISALAVNPFIYAALLIEVAVLGFVLMLLESSQPVSQGIIRFLSLQTMGMPFILLAGWFLASGEITPINQSQLILSVTLLVLGFAFWIGLFPLHTWMPMIAEKGEPIIVGFIFSVLPLAVLFFLMDFMNSYAWLRDYPLLYPVLRWLGGFMVLFSGIWSFFQKGLKGIFAYLAIALNGMALLSLGIKGLDGILILTFFLFPRFLSLLLFAFSLHILGKNEHDGQIEKLNGLAYRAPFSTVALLISILSITMIPFLPGFPLIQRLISDLINLSVLSLLMVLLGIILFMVKGFQIFLQAVQKDEEFIEIKENTQNRVLIGISIIMGLLTGIVPGTMNTIMIQTAEKFIQLLR